MSELREDQSNYLLDNQDGAAVKRVTLELSADAYNELLQMKKDYDARSIAEIIRNSLRLYKWYKEAASSYEIGLIKDNEVKKIVHLIF